MMSARPMVLKCYSGAEPQPQPYKTGSRLSCYRLWHLLDELYDLHK